VGRAAISLGNAAVALGDDPATTAQDAGHADMTVRFRISTRVMSFAEGDREPLRDVVEGRLVTDHLPPSAPAPNGSAVDRANRER
jgi:hypothetical protein